MNQKEKSLDKRIKSSRIVLQNDKENIPNRFKQEKSLEKRVKSSRIVLQNYKDCIPVIVQKNETCETLADMQQKQFLVPRDLTIGQFLFVIRRKIEMKPEQAIFFLVNNTLPLTSSTMGEIYEAYHDAEDGFLYCFYMQEKTFG